MISESSSGVCSTKPCQAGKGMGGKVPWEEEGLGYRDPERRSQGFAAGKSGQGREQTNTKNRDIKTICVEEENMDSRFIVLSASSKQNK